MRLISNGTQWSEYGYSTTMAWALVGAEGTQTVYVQYRDGAGNWSSICSDTIVLDTTPPVCQLTIDDGSAFANSIMVQVAVSGTDEASGVSTVQFRNDQAPWSNWQTVPTTSAIWTLDDAGDGVKTVYGRLRDGAGNVTTQPCSDTITLDRVAPTGSITISGGAERTDQITVTLALDGQDATSGVCEVQIRNSGSAWEAWRPFADTVDWVLPSGIGERVVEVRFRDHAGNESAIFSDSILLGHTVYIPLVARNAP